MHFNLNDFETVTFLSSFDLTELTELTKLTLPIASPVDIQRAKTPTNYRECANISRNFFACHGFKNNSN